MSAPSTRPTRLQILLLKAALLESPAAEKSFAIWRSQTDLFHLDEWSNGFMSLLYANLGDKRLPLEVREVLKGNYRYHWTRNRLWHKNATGLLRILTGEGVHPVIADDFRLAWEDYAEPAQRPLESLCLLLLESEVKTALALLKKSGWVTGYGVEVERQNNCTLSQEGAFSLRLEWRAIFEEIPTQIDREYRDRTLPFSFGGIELLQLHPMDQFFRISLRPYSPLRGIADIKMLTRHSRWDWNDLVLAARARERCLSSRHTLGLLAEVMPTVLPADILSQLRPSLLERLEDPFLRNPDWKGAQALFLYARSTESVTGTGKHSWLRVLFFSAFLAWQKIRRKVPGWVRQAVKKITARLNFNAPWLPRRT